jgi:hypothetical protein
MDMAILLHDGLCWTNRTSICHVLLKDTTGQGQAFAHTFGDSGLKQMADSASGGFVRQIPPLPVTPTVGRADREYFKTV